jgi:glutamyl-Q tRNA(Asp) synthetase
LRLTRSQGREPRGKTRNFPGTPVSPHKITQYVGRFAPSPTGALHLGSLVAALGSFLDARTAGGRWLVRMEDLDHARVVPGCAERMLRTLAAFGLTWDGVIEYQSTQLSHYRVALERLAAQGLTYLCSCTRRERAADGGYPGTCRAGPTRPGPAATRFRVAEGAVEFADRAQGRCRFDLGERGDVIVRRRDGAFAYQLAVVVDDGRQGVTDVVRGADLLDSTPWQRALQQALGLPAPRYLHLPLVLEADGKKLAKSKHSVPLDRRAAGRLLHEALTLLGQEPPLALARERPAAVLEWGLRHWNPGRLTGVRQVRAGG